MSSPVCIISMSWMFISDSDYYSLLAQSGLIPTNIVNDQYTVASSLLPFTENLKTAIGNFFQQTPYGEVCLSYNPVTIPSNGVSFTGIINGQSRAIGYLAATSGSQGAVNGSGGGSSTVASNPLYTNTYLGSNPMFTS